MYTLHQWCDAPTELGLQLLLQLKGLDFEVEQSGAAPSVQALIEREVDAPTRLIELDGPAPTLTADALMAWLDQRHPEPALHIDDASTERAQQIHRRLHPIISAFRWFSPQNEENLRASLEKRRGLLRWKLLKTRVRHALKLRLRIDATALSDLVPRFDQSLRAFEAQLEDAPFLGGDRLELPDLVAFSHLLRATFYCEGRRIQQHDALLAWFQRMGRVFSIERPEWASDHVLKPRRGHSGYKLTSVPSRRDSGSLPS